MPDSNASIRTKKKQTKKKKKKKKRDTHRGGGGGGGGFTNHTKNEQHTNLQSQASALPRHQEEEKTDKTKQAQIEQTHEKH